MLEKDVSGSDAAATHNALPKPGFPTSSGNGLLKTIINNHPISGMLIFVQNATSISFFFVFRFQIRAELNTSENQSQITNLQN